MLHSHIIHQNSTQKDDKTSRKNKFKECVQLNGINIENRYAYFTVTDGIFSNLPNTIIIVSLFYTSKEMVEEKREREKEFFHCLLIVERSVIV